MPPLAVAGTAGGELLLLHRVGKLRGAAWTKLAQLGAPVVAVAAAAENGSDAAGLLVAGSTQARVVVVRARRHAPPRRPSSGRRIALADVDGDGAPELIHVDAAGRLTVRAANR